MDERGDVMVTSSDIVSSADRTVGVTSVHLDESPGQPGASVDSSPSDAPEYATITRLRQHDPPAYARLHGDCSSTQKKGEEDADRESGKPVDDIGASGSRNEEDVIEVLDSHTEPTDEVKRHGANGYPFGAGWAISIPGGGAGGAKGDEDDPDTTTAARNSKILEQFEDKQKEKDECLVDCIYYTTTCCECTIL